MTNKQKQALTAGAAIGGVGFLLYRHFQGRTTVTRGGRLTNSYAQASSPVGSTTPFVPQTPIPLQPGESIYDPNSQALLNTPTAIPPRQSTTPTSPSYVVNVASPTTHATTLQRTRPAKRTVSKPPPVGTKSRKPKRKVFSA